MKQAEFEREQSQHILP